MLDLKANGFEEFLGGGFDTFDLRLRQTFDHAQILLGVSKRDKMAGRSRPPDSQRSLSL